MKSEVDAQSSEQGAPDWTKDAAREIATKVDIVKIGQSATADQLEQMVVDAYALVIAKHARRELAKDAFDHRFKETVIDCLRCERGWRHYDGIWVRCNDCQDGEIYTLLCSRCGLNENDCQCNVEDF